MRELTRTQSVIKLLQTYTPKSVVLDLGVRKLWPEWLNFFSVKNLKGDLIASLVVASVALPLSLAIAMASGMDPEIGLVSAIVPGMICALFGGSLLSVSGPAAAMAVIVASLISQYNLQTLAVIIFFAGILQLISGFLGLGRVMRYVPLPVIAGFTAGIGAIILIGQIPLTFGLPHPKNIDIYNISSYLRLHSHEISINAFFLASLAIGIAIFLPKYNSKIPAFLMAIVVPTVVNLLFGLNVSILGEVPSHLPVPKMVNFNLNPLQDLISPIFMMFFLVSMQTLLSSTAMDKITKGKPHDPSQELVGQGLGNMSSALFGGLPISSVIARSALNYRAGAKSRRSAIFHSLWLLVAVYFASSLIKFIPLCVLSGILISVALRMLHPSELMMLWRNSRFESFAYIITFLSILFFSLVIGIEIGILTTIVIVILKISQVQVNFKKDGGFGPTEVRLEGALTFLSTGKFRELQGMVEANDIENKVGKDRGLIIDLTNLTYMDILGAEQMLSILEKLIELNIKFGLKGVDRKVCDSLFKLDKINILKDKLIYDESDMKRIFYLDENAYSISRLIHGAKRFKNEVAINYHHVMDRLAQKQDPHTLFIACADSRIDPNLITGMGLGELLTIRNVGNIIPPFDPNSSSSEAAAIEFALGYLNIKEVVICGHSCCGAMSAIMDGSFMDKHAHAHDFPHLKNWLTIAYEVRKNLTPDMSLNQAAELNILLQLKNLKTYPIVQKKLSNKEINIHGWYYDIATGELKEWDEFQYIFAELGTNHTRNIEAHANAGSPLFSAA